MKTLNKKIFLCAMLLFAFAQLRSQNNETSRIPLLGEEAPAFTAQSTTGTINFPGDFGRKWKILFSHPADFTPVCTSELMTLAKMQQDFKDLDVELAVISTDPLYKHSMWVESMEQILSKDNEPVKIRFPLIDGSKLNIGWQYGMLTPSNESFKAVRGVFIIDPQNKIRSISFYPMEVGRNMDEIKRTVIAMQTAEKNTVLTPANWKPGDDVLELYRTDEYYKDPDKAKNYYDIAFYMKYRKLTK